MYRIQIKDMDFEQIARSGQCFRMEGREGENGVWSIAAAGEYVEAVKDGDYFLFSCGEREFKETWAGYFDLQTDYGGYKKHVDSEDVYLREAMEWGWGVRILHQDLWEMLVTFLISQNNNITRITGSVKELCKRFGDKRKGMGLTMSPDGSLKETVRSYDAFPEPESLSLAGLKGLSGLGLGYRDKYILSIAEMCSGPEGKEWLLHLKEADYKSAHSILMEQYGIGRKVADCICLFGLHHVGAFPVDTHVKQILELHYPQGFPLERYQGYAGILQQYMFYYKINQIPRSKLRGT
ncbi:N-glycosylase/DNA lyase [Lacrimispora sphenoides]|jgi:N-glycosylase/DNA lyase|uniref:DNA glycosylase n=1 Tax=Lacrimispora sphenoides TaxID=29370 RepID=UPI0008C6BDA9|nr:DNA glycosylase [Lacrimispora sphenoides]SET57951.1 N-glycosylase/DNA lyase [Lacrimispora sphenoides]